MYSPTKPPMHSEMGETPEMEAAEPVQESGEEEIQIKLQALSDMVADLQSALGAKIQPMEAEVVPEVGV